MVAEGHVGDGSDTEAHRTVLRVGVSFVIVDEGSPGVFEGGAGERCAGAGPGALVEVREERGGQFGVLMDGLERMGFGIADVEAGPICACGGAEDLCDLYGEFFGWEVNLNEGVEKVEGISGHECEEG